MSAQSTATIDAIARNENTLALVLSAQHEAVELRLALHAAKRRGGDFGVYNVAQALAAMPTIERALASCGDVLRAERGLLRDNGHVQNG